MTTRDKLRLFAWGCLLFAWLWVMILLVTAFACFEKGLCY